MKILSAAQLKEADKTTIEKQDISSEELMERAATLVFNEIHERMKDAGVPVKIFCGIGNNGGDGLVVARLLKEHDYEVEVFVVAYSEHRSKDFQANYEKLKMLSSQEPTVIKGEEDFPQLQSHDFVVDAIFGIGLNRPLEGWIAGLVRHINASEAFVLAIDMPSGLFSDRIPSESDAVLTADYTLSFQTPKLVFFLPQTMDYAGEVQILDIGLDKDFLYKLKVEMFLIGKEEGLQRYKPRKKNTHKGNYGHTLVVGGSYGKIGSIALSSTAVLKTGAGLCTIFAPRCGYQILQSVLPEAMVLTDEDEEKLTNIKTDLDADVICFGMGIGKDEATKAAFEELLKKTKKPMLIDADGLNLLSAHKEMLEFVPENSVFTPHPKELERLIGKWKDDFEKIDMVQEFCKKHEVVLVLKGAHTFTFAEGKIYVNTTGNPGMATAGSGDVLSGVIAGLMSQKYSPAEAAILGVYLHGSSADLAAQNCGFEALISGDIAENMGEAFLELMRGEEDEIGE
ncbi:MAG: NAD(P)H-hydrate dehydratase [Salegentibacter sp.]